jgi:cytochrome b pre-mRNA-processing protein 3
VVSLILKVSHFIISLMSLYISFPLVNAPGSAIDRYVMYPELLLVLTSYLRRELVRLEQVSDTTILGGKGRGMRESVFGPDPGTDLAAATIDLREAFRFGSVKDAARKVGVELKGVW